MINQGINIQKNVKHVKFCRLTKTINFYKDESPNLIPLYLPKIKKLNPSSDVFIKNDNEKVDEETKKNDEILSQLDEDDYKSTQHHNRKKLEELEDVNRRWNEQVVANKNERLLNEADLRSIEPYVNPRRLSSPFLI